jgi:CubicO group peptidase (beta-lactamase class C family)
MGYALLGYLVEYISKMPFDQYCKKHLFDPIGNGLNPLALDQMECFDNVRVPGRKEIQRA